ncbi:unnamed protein product [Medioppia subpectinata]|uniref:Uncharacterized protein n=1 Tax=Medioppia subpectinata TaxID=1979941 RepID=A0A7R9PXF1_9ACAR|nr:unnamed protein product [Medioppia subpectinata]CAG2104743.1 unnamed protein product [Medioppia subpectinata]
MNNTSDDDRDTNVGSDRKSWIRFGEEGGANDGEAVVTDEYRLEMPSPSAPESSGGCATIQPTDSIQINATTEYHAKRLAASSSPSANSSTQISIGLPLNASDRTTDANIMSNVESNKVIDKSFMKSHNNNNNNIMATDGESSHESNVKTLQNVSLKDTNNGNTFNECSHPSTAQSNGYSNGDVIVTLLPVNDSCAWITPAVFRPDCAWITPAVFRPELVPEELMAQSLSLTVEDYVSAIQVLVNDLRFNLYITLYKRMLVMWITLLPVNDSCAWITPAVFRPELVPEELMAQSLSLTVEDYVSAIQLYHMLERCISQVNGMLYKNNILLGVDDRGSLSCHKINLIFVYFDVTYCVKFLKDMLENESQPTNGEVSHSSSTIISRMDINTSDITITGSQPKSLSQKEKYAEKLLLRYSQRWVKDFVRRKIDLNMPLHADSAGVSVAPLPTTHRHCPTSRCLCQFIEEHLKFKPLTQCNITELFI